MKALKAHTGQRPKRQNRAIQSGNPTARSRNFNVINGLRELLHLSDGQEHQQAKQGKAPERSKQSTSKGKHQSKSTKGKHHRQRSKGKHRVRNHKRNNKIAPDQETSCNVQKTMLQCKPCKQHRSKQGIEESKPQASNKTSQYHAKTVLQCRSCNEAYEVEQVVSDDTGCSKPKQTWEGTLGKFPDTSKYATMQTCHQRYYSCRTKVWPGMTYLIEACYHGLYGIVRHSATSGLHTGK